MVRYYMNRVIPRHRLRRAQSHWPLFLILLVYLIAGDIYATSAPVLDVSDEVRHYAMIEHLARGNGLPIQNPAFNREQTRRELQDVVPLTYYAQEGSQPPLYYALMALVVLPFDRNDWAEVVQPNPHALLGRADATSNWNQLLHRPKEFMPLHKTALAVMVMRIIGILLGAVVVACTFALARELGREAKVERGMIVSPHFTLSFSLLPALAASIVAFNPMFVHIMASVNNDTLAAALSSLALLIGARMINRGATARSALLLGVVLGGAALSKASGVALAIAVPAFVAIGMWQRARQEDKETRRQGSISVSPRHHISLFVSMLLPVVLIAGWWYVRNWVLYGDPTGTTMMATIAGPRPYVPSTLALIDEWDGFFKAYWGLFGAVNIPMHEPVYVALEVMLVLAGIGLLLAIGAWLARTRREGLFVIRYSSFVICAMLFAAFLIAFIALIRWTSITLASQGRLLFPVIAPISIFIAIGLIHLWANVKRLASNTKFDVLRLICLAVSIPLATLTLTAPFVYIRPAYQAPHILRAETQLPADLAKTELYFEDKIRWIGYRVDSPNQRIRPGDTLDVTLYWQGLRPLDTNYSAFIRLMGRGDVPLALLDTYPGGGMWQTTLWHAGDIVADRYRIRIEDTITSTQITPTVLRLDVGFWDFKTKQFLETRDGLGNVTGRQTYEAASLNTARPAPNFALAERFENAKLTAARAEQTSNGVMLTLDWLVTQDFTQDYTTFVQLFDASGKQLPMQGDARAVNGDFSPRWWRVGDLVLNDIYTVPLPADIASGTYTIKFGLYNKDGVRMPVFDAQGQRMAEDALNLTVEIK
jgi:hypothetical protein